jgi:hypothetical protein
VGNVVGKLVGTLVGKRGAAIASRVGRQIADKTVA